ncbi:MAG: lasso peptide biosynthesis B2 protein [Candidatus Binataceae bacterium]
MPRLVKFARLRGSERALIARGWTEVALMRVATWTLPYSRVRAIVARRSAARAPTAAARPERERIAWSITVASAYVPGGRNCLVRALATEAMLGAFGYDGELKIGVARTADGQLRAHAWLESAGRPIIGDFDLDNYVMLTAHRAGKSSKHPA